MTLIAMPQLAPAQEVCANGCTCYYRQRRRNRFRRGIRIVAIAGMIYAGYVAYQRNLFHLENLSAAITWFSDRLRSEVETQKRLDELSSQLKAAEKRAAQLQRSLDKLTKSCGRSGDQTSGGAPWPFFSGR